jgi:glycosyltransferase involved in cell wall biosynthesis
VTAPRRPSRIHVLHWGTYDLGKPRTRILRAGILAIGATLDDCHTPVWAGLEDKTQLPGFWHRLQVLLRWLASYPLLIWRFLRAPRPDLVLTSFPGVLDTIILAPFAKLRRVPVVWDMFISAYDTLVFDRQLVRPGTHLAGCLRWLEGLAIGLADVVLLDTEAHARRIESLFELPPGRCGAVQVGAELEHFQPSLAGSPARSSSEPLQVLFYGQFVPLQGIATIVTAARLMREDAVVWTLIGRGQAATEISRMLVETPLAKVHWIDWVSYAELRAWIAKADLCLGIFGTSAKAASVIPNKVFQVIATGRPLVTRDSAAIRELLEHAPPCVYLIPAGDPTALAAAVREHILHMAGATGPACHGNIAEKIGASAIGRQFAELVTPKLSGK